MANLQTEQVFVMKISDGLYLDNLGNYFKTPPAGLTVYNMGGGILSFSPEAKADLISGNISYIFNQADPGWMSKMRSLGLDENVVNLLSKVGSLISTAATIVGAVQTAVKVLEWLEILDTGPTLEEITKDILANTETLIAMEAKDDFHNVELALADSRSKITESRLSCQNTSHSLNNFQITGLNDRKNAREGMLEAIKITVQGTFKSLEDAVWKLFYEDKEFKFYSPSFADYLHRKSDNGNEWIKAQIPVRGSMVFDSRVALPHAMYGITSFLGMLKLAYPEYRTLGVGREYMLEMAERLKILLQSMQKNMVRSILPAQVFEVSIPEYKLVNNGILFNKDFVRPFRYWQVGATDLTSDTNSYYEQIRETFRVKGETPPEKLVSLDFDWVPNPVSFSPDSTPSIDNPYYHTQYYKIVDPQAVADQANAQSEQDYLTLLQTNGYMDLARPGATLIIQARCIRTGLLCDLRKPC